MKTKNIVNAAIYIFLIGFGLTLNAQTPSKPSPKMITASDLFNKQKLEEAAKAFEEVTKEEPNNGRAWYMLGLSFHGLGKYEQAIEAFQKNIAIAQNPASMYNIACGYSHLNKKDKAFEWLEKAIINGFAQFANLDADKDLDNIRDDARFKKMQELTERQIKPCLFMPEARQFDFWIGDWDVFNQLGQKTGTNSVQQISEGCGLLENWTSTLKNNGKSINYYDPSTQKWYQFWIGSGAGALRFEGSYNNGAMRFEGETLGKDGKKTFNRLTFFKIDENTVRQFAEISNDDGKTWAVSYDFRYVRRVEKANIILQKVESKNSTTGGILSQTIEVPKGSTITVDGKMNDDEWKDALTQDLKGGGQLKLKHDGEFLQIGLQGGKPGLSHVYLTDGKDIYVLHASAALGQAIYKKEGEAWQPAQKFNWGLRDQAANSEGSSTFLKTNNWLASVPTPATTAREYKVAMKFRDGEIFRMAAAFTNNPTSPQFFPQTLADDTLKPELLFGSEPPDLNFKTEQWVTLKLKER